VKGVTHYERLFNCTDTDERPAYDSKPTRHSIIIPFWNISVKRSNVAASEVTTHSIENLYSPNNGRNNNELTNSTNKQQ